MKRTSPVPPSFAVATDGRGVVNHAGTAALHELADRTGYAVALGERMAHRCAPRIHHPGAVLTDLAVSIADGGDCLSDLRVLHDQPDLFGQVASIPTASRLIRQMTTEDLGGLREARRHMREAVWRQVGRGGPLVLDIDATLITSHSKKEGASGTFKRGFGFHPLLCFLEGSAEALAGILRPGKAGSNTVSDHIEVLDLALQQLPAGATQEPTLVRCDAAGGTHGFLHAVRERGLRFSVGFDLRSGAREAILKVPETAWEAARAQDGEEREGAAVCELSGLDLSEWPSGSRVICRRERLIPGSQLDLLTDHRGWRFQVFITDQEEDDIALLEARHRARAHCEDGIRCLKETGLGAFPFQGFVQNQIWLELALAAHDLLCHFRHLTLRGETQHWAPKALRYRLLHTAGRMVHRGRRIILRLQRTWPWTELLAIAFTRIRALPAT